MKRFFLLCLSLLLAVSVICGCASSKQTDAAPAARTASAQAQKQQATPTLNAALAQDAETAKAPRADAKTIEANAAKLQLDRDAAYTDKEHVAAYINEFQSLPKNYITKGEAKKLGWQTKGTLDKVAPGKSIGGDRYGNYEGLLPAKKGRSWKECDIDYRKGGRNAKRIVFSSDGLIYYTGDHYKTFTRLY